MPSCGNLPQLQWWVNHNVNSPIKRVTNLNKSETESNCIHDPFYETPPWRYRMGSAGQCPNRIEQTDELITDEPSSLCRPYLFTFYYQHLLSPSSLSISIWKPHSYRLAGRPSVRHQQRYAFIPIQTHCNWHDRCCDEFRNKQRARLSWNISIIKCNEMIIQWATSIKWRGRQRN